MEIRWHRPIFAAYRYRQIVGLWFSRVSRVTRITIRVSVRVRVRFGFNGPPYH